MRKIVGYTVYIWIQILLLPLGIIGGAIVFYKQVFVSKRLGVSGTAMEVMNGRWTMDKFGLRPDDATVRLHKVLPTASPFGLWITLLPLYLLKVMTGEHLIYPAINKEGEESIQDLIISRTQYFDEILARRLPLSEQFVILGAGFDTRSYGSLVHDDLTLFELDQSETQALKKEHIHKAGIDGSAVHFVTVDFSKDWFADLLLAGFDPDKSTTFLWEGVTLYLSEQDVRKTISKLIEHTNKSAILVADFYGQQFVNGTMYPGMKKSMKILDVTGESLGFGISFKNNSVDKFISFVDSLNMRLGQTFYMGQHTKKGIWMVVTEMELH